MAMDHRKRQNRRDSPSTLEDLRRLPYLDATLNETLRTLPPSSTVTRRLTRPVVLDGTLLQKAWGLIAEPRMVHGWERLYPDPGHFDPERFLGGGTEDRRYTYIPFGGELPILQASIDLIRLQTRQLHDVQLPEPPESPSLT
ncbi:MAG: cytochrome P450 [Cyanobium sp. PLM2.Bin73]|nr:MAG: cytochrome P450 [Cyanobium sp. PLM2.Bin73]